MCGELWVHLSQEGGLCGGEAQSPEICLKSPPCKESHETSEERVVDSLVTSQASASVSGSHERVKGFGDANRRRGLV